MPTARSSITNLLAGTLRSQSHADRLQDLRAEGPRAVGDRAPLAAADLLEVGGFSRRRSRSKRRRSACRRRAASARPRSRRTQIEDIGLRGRDFMGTLKTLPGVVDTSARDAPGWGSVGGMTINGQASFNFSYDGITNKDTGSNSRQLRGARARLDRRSQGAGVELPGRVRPHVRRDHRRRHQERQPSVPRSRRPTSSATRSSTRTRWDRRRQLRRRPGRRTAPNPNCRSRHTGTTTPRGRSAGRS